MKPRLLFSAILCFMLAFGAAGCSVSVNRDSDESSTESSAIGSEEVKAEDTTTDEDEIKEPEKPAPQPISVGQNISNDDFSITLTNARVDSVLQSGASSTYWQPQDGGAFVILEFDVTALNSNQLPVDDYAITDLVAKYGEDSYQGWRLQYITNQLWLSINHNYLDANLPTHIYAYTAVPSNALNEGSLSVDMTLAGNPYTITIR